MGELFFITVIAIVLFLGWLFFDDDDWGNPH